MASVLIVILILLGGLIAPFGDLLGTKIGKARFSILKLRPKKTATIVTIITGSFISSISIGLLLLVSEEFRQRLFVDIPLLQKTLDESKNALIPLKKERKKLEDKIIQKEKELNFLKDNISQFRKGDIVIKRGQTLFIAEINSSSNIKLELANINNEADKYVRKIVKPGNKEAKNILLWKPSDIIKIENVAAGSGNWVLLIKSGTNVLRGDNYVYVSPDLLENNLIVRKGDVIKSSILGESDLNLKSINLKIQSLLRETRDEIRSKGSQANEIKTRGNFVKKVRDFLRDNQNIKFKLEVVSLRDSKTVEPIVVEINILKILP